MLQKLVKRQFGKTAYVWSSAMFTSGQKKKPHLLQGFENNIDQIQMSDGHGALITCEGDLYTWGENKYGQLGIIDPSSKKPIPKTEQPTLVTYFKEKNIKLKQVVLGRRHTIVLDEHGRVFSWGRGTMSSKNIFKFFYPDTLALGHPESKNLYIPKPIKAFKDMPIAQISSGNDFAMALSKSNSLYVWGRGEFGVLGFINSQQKTPVINTIIEELTTNTLKSRIKKIQSCSDFSSVLFENGKIFSFGNNDQGNMGIGTTQSVDSCDVIQTPTECQFDDNMEIPFKDFSLGEMQSAYLSRENKVYFTGRKLVYRPKLFEIDYKTVTIKDFCATDKGVAVLSEDNQIYFNGNFWKGEVVDNDINTGIKTMDGNKIFDNKKIVEIGGAYSEKYALVEQFN